MEPAARRRRASDAEQSAWAYSVTAECEPVKEEPEWGECGVSEAAAAEGLYAGHEVKDEVVIGPEVVQKQDVAFTMQSALYRAEEDPCKLKPAGGAGAAPECTHTRPGEGPRCNMSQSYSHSGQETNFYHKACNETGYGKQYYDETYLVKDLAAKNVKKGNEKRLQNSSNEVRFANREGISYSINVSKSLSKIQSVLASETGKNLFSCNMCKKQFSQKQKLQKHIREKLCSGVVGEIQRPPKRNWTFHIFTHPGEKPYSCHICNKQFAERSNLIKHTEGHSAHLIKKSYSCNVCRRVFAQNSHLINHIKTHTGEKPFFCEVCKKQFASSVGLAQHKRIHTGEKSYSCSVYKNFVKRLHLIKHVKTHTDEKLCGSTSES